MCLKTPLSFLGLSLVLTVAACENPSSPARPGQGPASQAAPSGDATLDGPNVITYSHPEILTATTRFVRQGERLAGGGCAFSGSAILEPGSAVTELELAFDPDTCRSLVEAGTLVSWGDGANPDHVRSDVEVRDSTAGSVQGGGTPSMGIASVGQSAYIHSWYADPPGLHVNDVTSTVEWAPDGTCAWPAGTTARVSRSYQWLWQTGWLLRAYNWSYGYGCDKVYNGSTVHYMNDIFCVFMITNTYYEPARVEGLPDGRAAYFWSNRKDGPCAFLLSDNRRYGHGTP